MARRPDDFLSPPRFHPLDLAAKLGFYPLSRGDSFVTVGGFHSAELWARIDYPLFKRPTNEGRTFRGDFLIVGQICNLS